MRKLSLVLTACLLAGATFAAGVAQARQAPLDRSYGQDGYIDVQPPIPAPWRYQYVRDLVGAWDGDSFALVQRSHCTGACFNSENLLRYGSDGSLDPGFGGPAGSYELPAEGNGDPTLAVDSLDRPLLVQTSPNQLFVRRLTRSGVPDPTFGEDGTVKLECDSDCEFVGKQLIPGRNGEETVVLQSSFYGRAPTSPGTGQYGRSGVEVTLVRLKADGSPDRRFGHGGRASFYLRGAAHAVATASSRRGALYLGGAGCCGFDIPGYVVRVSAGGRLDRRFTTRSKRTLQITRRLGSLVESVNAVVVRPGGKLDLLGSAGYERGFVLRLNPNGRPHRRFARHGLRVLSVPVASAVPGSHGATLAVSNEAVRGVPAVLMRILPGGRLDPAFGRPGTPLRGDIDDHGLSVVHQRGRRALVLDLGLHECRGHCNPSPKLARFIEPRSRKRR